MSVAAIIALILAASAFLFAFRWLQDPHAVEQSGHDPKMFREVMSGRYAFMAAMLAGAAMSGHAGFIAFVLICLALVALWDWFVYSRSGFEATPHIIVAVPTFALGLLIALLS